MASRITSRARRDEGFTLVVVMLFLLGASMLSAAAWAAANGDIPLTGGDRDSKQAYGSAEAGIAWYQYHLNQDNLYWNRCAATSPISNGTGQRPWKAIPGTTAQYSVDLMPAAGHSQCDTNDQTSMVDPSSGTFRIRSTGLYNGRRRSVIAEFRRKAFLDFLYFTKFETLDPIVYQNQDNYQWLSQQCSQYRPQRPSACMPIVFANADQINGPLHTNDSILTCGSPTFGRAAGDQVEFSQPAPGWSNGYGCGGTPNFVGTVKAGVPTLDMPPSNSALKSVAQPGYLFTGTTTIVLNGSTMTVTNPTMRLNAVSMPLPPNGVIYAQNGACGTTYSLYQDYTDPAGCADLYIKGTYSQSLTVASENDIIVNGSVLRSGNAVLGMIANNFVRIYHPVTRQNGDNQNGGSTCTNVPGTPTNVEVDAAILSLQHSFIVDNYMCGAPLGQLTVKGAIAQSFRGPVGTGGTQVATGYTKNYNYDDRLKYTNPPFFLSPLQAPWQVVRYTEQIPAQNP